MATTSISRQIIHHCPHQLDNEYGPPSRPFYVPYLNSVICCAARRAPGNALRNHLLTHTKEKTPRAQVMAWANGFCYKGDYTVPATGVRVPPGLGGIGSAVWCCGQFQKSQDMNYHFYANPPHHPAPRRCSYLSLDGSAAIKLMVNDAGTHFVHDFADLPRAADGSVVPYDFFAADEETTRQLEIQYNVRATPPRQQRAEATDIVADEPNELASEASSNSSSESSDSMSQQQADPGALSISTMDGAQQGLPEPQPDMEEEPQALDHGSRDPEASTLAEAEADLSATSHVPQAEASPRHLGLNLEGATALVQKVRSFLEHETESLDVDLALAQEELRKLEKEVEAVRSALSRFIEPAPTQAGNGSRTQPEPPSKRSRTH